MRILTNTTSPNLLFSINFKAFENKNKLEGEEAYKIITVIKNGALKKKKKLTNIYMERCCPTTGLVVNSIKMSEKILHIF